VGRASEKKSSDGRRRTFCFFFERCTARPAPSANAPMRWPACARGRRERGWAWRGGALQAQGEGRAARQQCQRAAAKEKKGTGDAATLAVRRKKEKMKSSLRPRRARGRFTHTHTHTLTGGLQPRATLAPGQRRARWWGARLKNTHTSPQKKKTKPSLSRSLQSMPPCPAASAGPRERKQTHIPALTLRSLPSNTHSSPPLHRIRSTCGGRSTARPRRTRTWQSTSAGRWTGTPGWTRRSRPSTCAPAARPP
jgi:hypothetical protein